MIAKNVVPSSTSSGEPPISRRKKAAPRIPAIATTRERPIPTRIDWTAVLEAASASPSPTRRATIAVVPIENPMASANTIIRTASVRVTTAIGVVPSLATK